MKKRYLSFLLLASAISACDMKPMDHFVLRGTIPGAMDSTEIELAIPGENKERLKGFIVNERFEFRGKLEQPTLCELRLNNQDICDRKNIKEENKIIYADINFFVENGELTFTTPHVDSLPHSFWKYDIRKEKNYTLTGSPAQDIYYAYQQQTIPARHLLRTFRFQENKQPEDAKRMIAAQAELARQNREFIAGHSNLAVNLVLVEELKKEPFTYDQGYLDELEQLFASYRDTCPRLKNFRQYLKEASAFAQGKPLQEGKVITPKGDTLSLLAQLKAGQYTLIDFWASWCGPCRASFPHLREMYKLHGEKVNFISVSLDKEEKEWQKAMGEEKLPWSQFLATRALSKEVGKYYNLKSIPTFLFIDPDGKIIFSGHSSDELEAELAKTH
ncbi:MULTISPECIES: TlpA disulfide reductase family protein [Butyricimonas]|uniref:TlpA disulfide reductase family protein n=1 Tax=Butyricimonas TaxID=574697 RepID=UPI001D095CA8|nr:MULTISPECIES: TlpA disulfide reductase family protein [Butyricimonas]MCB6971476.1 AhpC/TSA family protein [Butyricimonas synergistica]MCG4518190.1 AhpC/TSA family protein [Butyricimonas sp. DFI.6.44]